VDRLWGAAIALVAILAAIGGMGISWRARRRRQGGLDGVAAVPAETGALLLAAEGLHVATTRGGSPLDRVAVGGLGFRAEALVEVHELGIVLALAGAQDRWIAREQIRGADRATWTIDRTVEPDGLVLLAWTLAGDDVDTYFRVEQPAALLDAIHRIADKETA
jgi:hypothetical protein